MTAQADNTKAWVLYLLECANGAYYAGITNDLEGRLAAHACGRGAKYTRAHTALDFAYLEECADKSAALRREIALKKLPKARKEALCAGWAAANMHLNMHKI